MSNAETISTPAKSDHTVSAPVNISGKRRLAERAAVLLPLLAALAVFGPSLAFPFVNLDDARNIFQNRHIVPVGGQTVGYFWTHPYFDLFMPLTYTIWSWLARIGPLPGANLMIPGNGPAPISAMAYHAASVALHVVNVVLVWTLLRRLRLGPWPSALGATLFAIHPVQVESVSWVTGMNNLIGGALCLLAILFYNAGVRRDEQANRAGRMRCLLAAFVCYAFALLSKPTSVALPLILAAFEYFYFRRPMRRWLPTLALWALPALALSVATRFTSAVDSDRVHSPLWGRPFIVGDALAFYLGKIVWPNPLGYDYGRTIPMVLGHWWGYATWLLPAAIVVLLVRTRGEAARYLRLAGGIFVAAVLPMLGLIPYYAQNIATVSDRYLYLALAGLALALAWALERASADARLGRARPAIYAACVVWLAALGVRCAFQSQTWRDSYALSANTINVNPRNTTAHRNLGISLALAGDITGALREFRIAEQQMPEAAPNHYHVAITLAAMNDFPGAADEFRNAVALDPKFDEAWFRLGVVDGQLGQVAEAKAALRQRLRFRPEDGEAHYILGVLLGNEHRNAEALSELQTAVRLIPQFPDAHYSLGKTLDRLGRHAEAVPEYREALRLDPTNARAAAALGVAPIPKPSSPREITKP